MHGGEIIVASELGVGSTFRLRLPCRDTDHGDTIIDSALTVNREVAHEADLDDEVSQRRIERAG
jgi:hypothetical protein